LAAGKIADLVLLRRDTPAFTPLNDVMSQLAFCENGSSVDTVIVDGAVIVEGGRLKTLDEKEVLALATKARERLNPAIEKEMAAARTMEPVLADMYFDIFKRGS
jgi:5-methylthioadenosine/S-adenosylhomocysteine deaminase